MKGNTRQKVCNVLATIVGGCSLEILRHENNRNGTKNVSLKAGDQSVGLRMIVENMCFHDHNRERHTLFLDHCTLKSHVFAFRRPIDACVIWGYDYVYIVMVHETIFAVNIYTEFKYVFNVMERI